MSSTTLNFSENAAFMFEWLKAPLITASVMPSSRALSRKMVSGLPDNTKSVIELGPGTGVFTSELLRSGIQEEALTLVELNSLFADQLRKKFPKATLVNRSAKALGKFQLNKADAVISGLPLLSMHDHDIADVLAGAFEVMAPNGVLVQFTYGYKCPVKTSILQQQGLMATRHCFVFNNFPPASIYHIKNCQCQKLM